MGWFWADSDVSIVNARTALHTIPKDNTLEPPVHLSSFLKSLSANFLQPGCPMHKSADASPTAAVPKPKTPSPETACPYTPADVSKPTANTPSKYSKYNPLNYMFSDLSQSPAENQKVALPTGREPSTIPKGSGDGNWEYPSPQQMYNALLRKGYTDTDATAVESMVSVHNFLNEGAWAEIVEWEQRFGKGLGKGWEACRKGEQGWNELPETEKDQAQPKLIRFMGRPKEMTPKAAMIQVMGKIYPSAFGTEPPFDRHDWFVERQYNGQKKEIRYVIDYYSGQDDPNGQPVFYLDVRPAVTPTAAVERMMRWGGDVWYRASGAKARE